MIRRSTLREQLTGALREEVLAGRLVAGLEFTVREIAESYGVSTTPAREALLDLSAQGLLLVEQHRGFRVRSYTLTDFREMIEARSVVREGLPLADAGRPPPDYPPDAFTSIRRRAATSGQAARAGDLDILVGYDLRFWRELTALRSNPYIAEFLDRLRAQCWAFLVPQLRAVADGPCASTVPDLLWDGYLELADAVERHDDTEAGALVRGAHEHVLEAAAELAARAEAAGRRGDRPGGAPLGPAGGESAGPAPGQDIGRDVFPDRDAG
ncbi:GntR family transcriptional regulator [Streptomyces lonarensis]|uniref:GntR family transcriptional regulator n=1 Tax=Streptomyces lonarensis TaxID=700599 RepID=UPI0030C6DB56